MKLFQIVKFSMIITIKAISPQSKPIKSILLFLLPIIFRCSDGKQIPIITTNVWTGSQDTPTITKTFTKNIPFILDVLR